MPRVRVPLTLTLPVTDAQLGLLQAVAPFVRAAREHAPALRAVGVAAKAAVTEADRVLRAERAKRPKQAKPRRANR